MHIQAEIQQKSKSNNTIYLLKKAKEIESYNLTKKASSYVEDQLKDGKFVEQSMGSGIGAMKIGKLADAYDRDEIRKFGAQVYKSLANHCDDIQVESPSKEAIELFVEGFALSAYKFDKYLSKKKENKLKAVYTTNQKADLNTVMHIVEATNWARTLVNEPVSYLTASQFSADIVEKCKDSGVKVEVLEKAKIESLKMGGLLAVNKGSIDPPTFTIMEWKPKKVTNKKPIVLVGKGIVYDTGGLSLKPTANSMDMMKCDMAGGAAMAATIYAVAKLNLPIHVITLIPATDNRPGGNAYAPGDIITMFNGMTVEVLNTDAEGRMALADALAYSDKFKPELVIDAATLTGAAARAIGVHASVVMGNADKAELDLLEEAGNHTFDRIASFPFWREYGDEMKSKIADLKNLGGAEAGMITAGKFLENFTSSPYIHLDIAGPSFILSEKGYNPAGGTGTAVRLLVEFLKRKAK
ncbi:leucyl aminopeptidase [Paracrocinitomix mangrovi]|uniref:leucyl aminopeptidase family protein n=1 Tax=Paracrocinitomix mangrovi TaxID=2862509 RepID=UPI001C8D003C|nr:leucyl aminopeptidase [Paracrocinitomix mangrovi]UKN00847.1 leucyl aminopeptidase [Paracrocinitomix mangrovi]